MLITTVGRREGESEEHWLSRVEWSRYAEDNWRSLAAADRMRSVLTGAPPDWNVDENIAYYSRSALSDAQIIQSRQYNPLPWEVSGPRPNATCNPLFVQCSKPPAASEATWHAPLSGPYIPSPPAPSYVPLWAVPVRLPQTIEISDSRISTPSLVEMIARSTETNCSVINGSFGGFGGSGGLSPVTEVLPMRASSAAKWIRRGAEVLWENKRWVMRAGEKVLGPIGVAGDIKDAIDFISWLNSEAGKHAVDLKYVPKVRYQFSDNTFFFECPDGSVTSTPRNWSPILR